MEKSTGGELFDVITEGGKSEDEAAKIIKQLLGCFAHCHHNHVVHRDIKPENVLLEEGDEDFHHLKLVDFGSAANMDLPAYEDGCKGLIGTPYYVAPEVI